MRIAGMHETEMQFDDKMQTEDRMTINDRQEEIMTSNLAAFYGDRAAARALMRRTDPRGSGIPDPRPADDDADDGLAEDEEADFGPFTTDSLRSSATRSYIVRRLSAATEGPGGSFVRDVEQAARRPMTAAAAMEDLDHVTIDKRGNDAILRESEYEQSKGTFTWSSNDWHVEPDEEAERRESRNPRDNFKDLMAFFAVSRKKNSQVVSAFNISVKEAFDLFPNEAYTSTHDELSKVLHRTFEPQDFKRLTKMQKNSGIPCMLFLRTKMHPMTNDFLKLKARLVACELRARASAKDIENASSPTVSMTSFLVFATICAKRGWQLGTADCPNAYLNAEVNPDLEPKFAVFDKTTTRIALEIRPELQALLDHKGRLRGRLRFSLYGLLQSGKNWYMHISTTLRSLGLEASDCDPCVWFGTFQGQELILLLYVDDVIVGTELTSTIRALFEALDKTYKGIIDTANCDDILTYLGMSIDNRESDTIYVHQPVFTEQLLKDVNNGMFGNIKEKKSPAPADALSLDDDAPVLTQAGSAYYRSTLMRIAYLVNCTRPDLKVALMALSRRMHCATTQDASRLMHLVGYISVTRTYGLTIRPGEGDLTVFGYTDASHATMHDMRSVTGGAICVGTGGATVFSKTSKQTIVAKSSMEAEYIACSDVTSQIIHVRNLLISAGGRVRRQQLGHRRGEEGQAHSDADKAHRGQGRVGDRATHDHEGNQDRVLPDAEPTGGLHDQATLRPPPPEDDRVDLGMGAPPGPVRDGARVQGPLVRASPTSSADDSPSLPLRDDALVSRVHSCGQAQRAPPMIRRRSSPRGRCARVQGPLVRTSSTSSADDSPSLPLRDEALVSRVHSCGHAQRSPPRRHPPSPLTLPSSSSSAVL